MGTLPVVQDHPVVGGCNWYCQPPNHVIEVLAELPTCREHVMRDLAIYHRREGWKSIDARPAREADVNEWRLKLNYGIDPDGRIHPDNLPGPESEPWLVWLAPLLVVLCLMFALATASAATYQVTQAGSDSAPCGQGARRSINGGLACLQSGDTLLVGPGTYAEQISDRGCNAGQACVPPPSGTTIKAAQPGTVTLKGTGTGGTNNTLVVLEQASTRQVRIDGLILDAQGMDSCGSTWHSTGIQFVNVECKNGQQGFVGSGSDLLFDTVQVRHIGGGQYGGKACTGGSEPWEGMCHGFYFMSGGATGPITIRNSRISDVNGYRVQTYVPGVRVENTASSEILYDEPRIMCVAGGCTWDGTTPAPGTSAPAPSGPITLPLPFVPPQIAPSQAMPPRTTVAAPPRLTTPRLTTPGACTVR